MSTGLVVLLIVAYTVATTEKIWCTKTQECPFSSSKCRKIYLDVGSNIGVQVRKLFEPAKFPHAKVKGIFNQHFGTAVDRRNDICAIGFEPNRAHTAMLTDIARVYTRLGWRTIFIPAAVAATDGDVLTFYSENSTKNIYNWGASVFAHDGSLNVSYQVPTVDLAEFVLNLITFHEPEVVVMKVDIEGSEYSVIPRMIKRDAFCNIDVAFIEWHPHFFKESRVARWMARRLTQSVSPSLACRGCNIVLLDDERSSDSLWDGGP